MIKNKIIQYILLQIQQHQQQQQQQQKFIQQHEEIRRPAHLARPHILKTRVVSRS
jgi:hypothetical protein